ncbi:hypothetical protein BO70DRAFT_395360 [Aspergillus heteromorphus CBS 117.55]|uniref:Ilp is an apoptosis inhibitor n=1 Tax=Aspergillus heteromorphus CBS 117.55 TaxID=1448321 RepID=A0A317WIQ5_9EURO|nr:uncharacterized protein BO70DRAFT_395360 [Aspergillus heteromorphus CBS 117.55]PWY86253.1 hypothetical protein BO70DRAFT_395360 [Aspergillus heteromorphus CBS 117.55]
MWQISGAGSAESEGVQRQQSYYDDDDDVEPPKFEPSADPRAPDERQPALNPATMVGLAEASGDNFDIFEWYPRYQNCQRYFLDHAQHSVPVQALSAFLNIRLPCQWQTNPVANSRAESPSPASSASSASASPITSTPLSAVSLIPYIRRLVATGMDFPGVLHGFFGDDWSTGIGSLHEQERRNYLFAAKSGGWAAVKKDYDIPPLETIPFLRPLQGPLDSEIEAAERSWSEWLAMEDWMVGPRAPDVLRDSSSQLSQPQSSQG